MARLLNFWETNGFEDACRCMKYERLEGLARQLLAWAGLLGERNPLPSRVLAALMRARRLTVRMTAPPKTQGLYAKNVIYLDPSTPEEDMEDLIAHELSHWILSQFNIEEPVQEAVMVTFMLCWRLPCDAVCKIIRKNEGFLYAIDELLATYGDIASPCSILVRAALAVKVGIRIFDERGKVVRVGAGIYRVNLELSDREITSCARRALCLDRSEADPRGFVAAPVATRFGRMAVLVVDLTMFEYEMA